MTCIRHTMTGIHYTAGTYTRMPVRKQGLQLSKERVIELDQQKMLLVRKPDNPVMGTNWLKERTISCKLLSDHPQSLQML